MDGAEDHYFCAFRDGELVAALPTFLKEESLATYVTRCHFMEVTEVVCI